MRCGNCKRDDADVSVEHVRACYGVPKSASPPSTSQGYTYGPRDELPFPAGRYAVKMSDGRLHFFHVQAGKNRWEGYTFLKEQAGDDLHPVKSIGRRNEVYNLIAVAPEEAMLAYGRELGECGHCGRTLTDEDSRAAGIGPVCRNKVTF